MLCLQKKFIISINGPVVLAKGDGDFAMHDMVYVGKIRIIGEVIKLNGDIATLQVLLYHHRCHILLQLQ